MKKIIVVLLLVIGFSTLQAQVVGTNPRAVIGFNPDKRGEVNIDFNSSFLTKDFNLNASEKNKVKETILKKHSSIKEIEFIDVDNNSGMLVKVNFFAKDKKELSEKIRAILTEIGISRVEYNGTTYNSLVEFSF